jgi:small subunit ribosomal protein S24e
MDVEVTEDRKNPLLGRREVKFKVSFQGQTPTRKDVRSKVVAVLNSDKELTILDKVAPDYGAQTAKGYVKVYADKEAMKIEPAYKMKRNFPPAKAEGEAATAPAEAAKPKEEK